MTLNDNTIKTINFNIVNKELGDYNIIFKQFKNNDFSISILGGENFQYYSNSKRSPICFLKKMNLDDFEEEINTGHFVGSKLWDIDVKKTITNVLKELKEVDKELKHDKEKSLNEEESLEMVKTLINFFEKNKGLNKEEISNIFNGHIDFVTKNGKRFFYSDYDEYPSFLYKINENHKDFFDIIFPQIIKGIEERI